MFSNQNSVNIINLGINDINVRDKKYSELPKMDIKRQNNWSPTIVQSNKSPSIGRESTRSSIRYNSNRNSEIELPSLTHNKHAKFENASTHSETALSKKSLSLYDINSKYDDNKSTITERIKEVYFDEKSLSQWSKIKSQYLLPRPSKYEQKDVAKINDSSSITLEALEKKARIRFYDNYIRIRSEKSNNNHHNLETAKRAEKYEPTYRLEPRKKFNKLEAEFIIKDVLYNSLHMLSAETMNSKGTIKALIDHLSTSIKNKTKAISDPRYKLVVHTVITEQKYQGLIVASKCIWDTNNDICVSVQETHKNYSIVINLYAIYHE